jgi:hypothetical protein
MLNLSLIDRYAAVTSLKARLDFWQGNYEAGLTRLYHFMIFAMDLYTGSTRLQEQETALACFKQMCLEMIPLLLSYEIYPDALAPYQVECLAVFGNYKKELFTFSNDLPPGESEAEPPAGLHLRFPIMHSIEQLIQTALSQFEPRTIFYKEYLNLVKNYGDIYSIVGLTPSDYHIYGKLRFWEQWFSINRYFYKEGIEFYRDLFEGMKYIRDMHDKSIYINDYFEKHTAAGETGLIISKVHRSAYTLTVSRTLGKLAAIVSLINTKGMESTEFLTLKGTNEFIDELTGNKFEIVGEGEERAIILDKNFKLGLKKIHYGENHKRILDSFAYFKK